MFQSIQWHLMVYCGLFACAITGLIESKDLKNSCSRIGEVFELPFQKHSQPQEVNNLIICKNGLSCCNTISEFNFENSVTKGFTQFALYTVNTRLKNFKNSVYAEQINWEQFNQVISQAEDGLEITYEDFFNVAIHSLVKIKTEGNCMKRKEMRDLRNATFPYIITLVNNIYAYQKSVHALNVTLQATATMKPSLRCARLVTKAGIPTSKTMDITGCPLCLDSTASSRVCLDYCLNVVRGCYASILNYQSDYHTLIQALDDVYFDLNYHLESSEGALQNFYDTVELKLYGKFVEECTRPFKRSERRTKRYSEGEDYPAPDYSAFKRFFSEQLDLGRAIVDPGTLPCTVSNNSPTCWNGKGIGSYNEGAYSYTIDDQQINPEGSDLEMNEFQEAAVELLKSSIITCEKAGKNDLIFKLKKSLVDMTSSPSIDIPSTKVPPEKPAKPKTGSPKGVYTINNNVVKTVGPVNNSVNEVIKSEIKEGDNNSVNVTSSLTLILILLVAVLNR